MIQQQARVRVESSVRCMRAAERAIGEGIQVCQLQGSGQWITTSGSQERFAYEVDVTGNVAHGCDCLAGLNNDPVCKHKAAFYMLIGALDLTPEPEPPALGATGECPTCLGCGVRYDRTLEHVGWLHPPCAACGGSGIVPQPTIVPLPQTPARVAA